MVNVVVSAGRNGVHDFILLRASAIILVLYTLFLAAFFIVTPSVTYDVWQAFFACMSVKVATMLALIALLVHAKTGVWQVLSDYIKPALLRGVLQFLFSVLLLAYIVFGFSIVWGV
ncbi:MAG: succinate dehydrogenase, hydrophobic membrane anchor protein [Litorilituus sp.]|jgi:succinate dehydrogenase / fumarate reductase membrane anchor subunit|nr:succinate dehydrogenase, hydrophobic membrane anchor protein [Litorilituus sp.]